MAAARLRLTSRSVPSDVSCRLFATPKTLQCPWFAMRFQSQATSQSRGADNLGTLICWHVLVCYDRLIGDPVIPGFTLPVFELFTWG